MFAVHDASNSRQSLSSATRNRPLTVKEPKEKQDAVDEMFEGSGERVVEEEKAVQHFQCQTSEPSKSFVSLQYPFSRLFQVLQSRAIL